MADQQRQQQEDGASGMRASSTAAASRTAGNPKRSPSSDRKSEAEGNPIEHGGLHILAKAARVDKKDDSSDSHSSTGSDGMGHGDDQESDQDEDGDKKLPASDSSTTARLVSTAANSKGTAASSTNSDSAKSKKRKRASETAGMSAEERWEWMFERLQKFKAKHKHCNVPNRFPEDPSLGCWVSTQRRQYNKAKQKPGEGLTQDRIARLERLGFEWTGENPRHKNWDIRFEELKKFKAHYGHAQVPIGFEDNVQLANWTSTQRQEYKNILKGKPSRLSQERVDMLNGVGFVWELQRGGRKRRVKIANRHTGSTKTQDKDDETMSKADSVKDRKEGGVQGTAAATNNRNTTATTSKKKAKATTANQGGQAYSTALVLPGVALMGGDETSPRRPGSQAAAAHAARCDANARSGGDGGGNSADESAQQPQGREQQENEVVARTEASRAGTDTVNNAAEQGISAAVHTAADTELLARALLQQNRLTSHSRAGITSSLLQALNRTANADLGMTSLSAYQRALLLDNPGLGLSRDPLLGQRLGTTAGFFPGESSLRTSGLSHGILQQLGPLPNQRPNLREVAAGLPSSLLLEAAEVLLQEHRRQQEAQSLLAPSRASVLESRLLNRRQPREPSGVIARESPTEMAETKIDDQAPRPAGEAQLPGSPGGREGT